MKIILLRILLLCVLMLAGCGNSGTEPGEAAPEDGNMTIVPVFDQFAPPAAGEEYVVITTDYGIIELRLFPEFAPMAVENFVTLAKNGYYDGLIFHRVIQDFMIQTGDPEGTGFGGESIFGGGFEIEVNPNLRHFNGALAMARAQAIDSQRSQFYIVQNDELPDFYLPEFNFMKEHQDEEIEEGSGIFYRDYFPTSIIENFLEHGGVPRLDFQYTVFGQVFSGIEVVRAIAAVETNEDDRPINDVFMTRVEIKQYGQ